MKGRIVHLSVVHQARDPRILWKEAASAARAGYDTFVVARHHRKETDFGVQIVPLKNPKHTRYGLAAHAESFRIVRSLAPDLVHFHDPELIPLCYWLKRRLSVRVVYDAHEDYRRRPGWEGRFISVLERWCFRWVDHVIFAFEPSGRHASVPGTPVLNYFLPPRDSGAEVERPGKPFTLVYAGVQGCGRGMGTLLEMARLIRERDFKWKILLAGICHRRSERQRAEETVSRHQLGGVIEFVGWDRYLPWEELVALYPGCHVGMALYQPNPGYAHSIPTKFFEYMHFGLPIVCSNHGLMPAFVERHGCGIAVRHDDARQILSVIERWSSDPKQYEELAANAKSAASRYHWSVMEERLLRVYEEVLDGDDRRTP